MGKAEETDRLLIEKTEKKRRKLIDFWEEVDRTAPRKSGMIDIVYNSENALCDNEA